MLSKEDKKLRNKIEFIGIGVITLMLLLLVAIKGVKPTEDNSVTGETNTEVENTVVENSETNTTNESTGEASTTQEITNTDVQIDTPTDESTAGVVAEVTESTLNADLASSDPEAFGLVNNFMIISGVEGDFNPIYSTTKSLRLDENNNLVYEYTYRADDSLSMGKYSNLNVEITKNVDGIIQSARYTLGVSDDLQILSTARANAAHALSTIYDADLYMLSTVDDSIDFIYGADGDKYTINLSQASSYQNDHAILYYTVTKANTHATKYAEHKEDVENKFQFNNLVKERDVDISTGEFIDEMRTMLKMENTTYFLREANIFEYTDKIIEKLAYDLGNATVEVESSVDKRNDAPAYIVRFNNSGKSDEELKNIGVEIADKLFNVAINGEFIADETNELAYLSNSRVVIKVSHGNLEVATAKSNYDFNTYINNHLNVEEVVVPEVVMDPDTMEYIYVYPDIQGEPEPEATHNSGE